MGGVSSFTSQVKEDVYDSLKDYLEGNGKIRIPHGVTELRARCFDNCIMTTIVIPETVQTVYSDAFTNCPNLTTITINKPTDSIAGAPWGATNANVEWNG